MPVPMATANSPSARKADITLGASPFREGSRGLLRVVILSEAKDLLSRAPAKSRSFAALGMTTCELEIPRIDAFSFRSLLCSVPITTVNSRLRVSDDISKLVGDTPMLHMKRLAPPGAADIFAKLEYLNPGGSVKDRAAIGLIARAEREGKLKPGGPIVEATAGNTGIGLALIGVSRGYKVALFVPERFSEEKVIIMRALGAEVTRTPESEGMQGAIDRANALAAARPGGFMAGQFENPANPDYHYETTAAEMFEQMEGKLDAIAIGAGT